MKLIAPSIVGFVSRVAIIATMLSALSALAVAQKSSPAAIEQYRAAVELQNQQLYDLAAEEWLIFTKKFKDDPYIGNANHYLGVCYFQTEAYAKADNAFAAALAANALKNPKGKVAVPATLLNQGLARFNLGQGDNKQPLDGAIQTLSRLKSEFGNSKEAKEGNYYLAESLFAVGRKDEAKQLYEQTVNHSPKHPQREKLLYGLGVAYQESKDVDKAQSTFRKLLNEFPQSEFGDEIMTRRGDTLFSAKKYGEAAGAFAKVAAKSNSEFADYALLQQAACEFKQKKYAGAGRLYASVVQRFPKSEYVDAATLSAGKCLHLGGDPQAAEWLAKASRTKGVGGFEAAHWLARVRIKNNQSAAAIAPLEKAIRGAKKNDKAKDILPQLRLDLADALYENKDRRADAAKLYEQVANQHKDHEAAPQARYMAAFAALDRREHQAARQHAQQFLNSWPKDDLRPDIIAIDAESLLQLGKHDDAGKKFEQLVHQFSKRPERESWISRRAICLNRANKHDEVVNWLNARMKGIQSKEIKGESQFLLGSAYLNKGDTHKAIQLLNDSINTSPNGLQADRALLLLGEAQQQAKQPEQALASIRRLLQEKPNSEVAGQARFREAELLYAAGDFKTASTSYQAVIQNDKQRDLHPSALFGLAWSQLSIEDYDAAVQTLDSLKSQHGDHKLAKKARYAMGVAYQQKQEYDRAINALNGYLQDKLDKTDKADAFYLRGLCLVGKGDFQKAANDFQAVTTTDPQYVDTEQVLYELAWAYQDGEKPDQAVDAFRKVAEKFPNGPLAAESWYRVAERDYAQKKYSESVGAYQKALAAAKDQPEIAERAAHKLGWANYQQKKYSEAEKAFAAQIAQQGDGELVATGKLMAAECAYQLKQYDRAYSQFQKAMPGANSVSASLRSLSTLHAGQCAGQLKQWQASANLLSKCVEEFPDSGSVHQARYELGFALQNLNQPDKLAKAKELYEQVAAGTTAPVGARARFMLGELQFAEEDFNGAIRTFAKVFSGYGGAKAPNEYHQWQADALFEAARCCESTKRVESARRFYAQLIKNYPQSDKVSAAQTKLKNLGG